MLARSYLVPAHLVVTPDVAPMLAALLRPGRRDARVNHLLSPSDPVHTWLRDLDTWNLSMGQVTIADEPVPHWLTTAEAAALLGIGDRAMRFLERGIRNCKVGNRRVWLEADVMAEMDARCV